MKPVFALLGGETIAFERLGLTRDEFFALCDREDLHGLMYWRAASLDGDDRWPPEIFDALAQAARDETARELVRAAEIAAVLDALRTAGVDPLVMKGSALAYTVYETPIGRPRLDTDLLIDEKNAERARAVLAQRGYVAPPYCDALFSQFEMEKTDTFGVRHVFDVHWKVSTQSMFADVLRYSDMRSRAVPIPPLGPAAFTPGVIDALTLACIHPAMHHQSAERILWIYDTHLLASRLTHDGFCEFARLAREKRVAAICARELRRAHARFATVVPEDVLRDLSEAAGEPSAAYLASDRTWRDELASSMRGLPAFGDRVMLLREVLLPRPSYMLGVYGLRGKPLASLLLPALYVHRNVRGAWRILTGKK